MPPLPRRLQLLGALASVALIALASPAGAQGVSPADDPPLRYITVSEGLRAEDAIRALQGVEYSPTTPRAWLFSIHYSGGGEVDSVTHDRPGSLPTATVDMVAAILRAAARRLEPNDTAAVLDVVALPGESPTVRDPTTDRPVLRNGREVQRHLSVFIANFISERPGLKGHPPVSVTVKMRVDTTGRPGEIKVEDRSLFPEFNRSAVALARRMRFRPARIEGEPVSVWVILPMNFTL